MIATVGWDIGGAHVKAALAAGGRIVAVSSAAVPAWLGLDRLEAGMRSALAELRDVPADARHAATMTAELSDLFASRAEGVVAIARLLGEVTAGAELSLYAGRADFVKPQEAGRAVVDIASANWHATAALLARRHDEAILIDMGSTTTDLIPVEKGHVAARGYSDAERLATGELIYQGFTRTALMALSGPVPVKGRMQPLMNEYFATIADARRVLDELPEGADRHDTADHRDKGQRASIERLARMIGLDASEARDEEWRALARVFTERQLRLVADALDLVLSSVALSTAAPIVGAGVGRPVVSGLAARIGRRFIPYADLVPALPEIALKAADAAPACAVALLSGQPG